MTYNENFYKIIKTGTYIGKYEIINTCLEFRCNTIKVEIGFPSE